MDINMDIVEQARIAARYSCKLNDVDIVQSKPSKPLEPLEPLDGSKGSELK